MNETTEFASSAESLPHGIVTNTSQEIEPDSESSDFWSVKTLYPMVGVYPLCVAGIFLMYFARDWSKKKTNGGGGAAAAFVKEKSGEAEAEPALTDTVGGKRGGSPVIEIVVVALLAVLFFLYVGLEVAFGTFLTVFSVKSKLGTKL
jgi:hypothetical protein